MKLIEADSSGACTAGRASDSGQVLDAETERRYFKCLLPNIIVRVGDDVDVRLCAMQETDAAVARKNNGRICLI